MTDAPWQEDRDFAAQIALTLQHEGGLSDDPTDPGGLTNHGFALRDNPDLTDGALRAMTADQAAARYYARWWLPHRFGKLPAPIGGKVFDLAIDIGATSAIVCLQRSLRACGHLVHEDGALGLETISTANCLIARDLLPPLRAELAAHYRLVAQARPLEGARDLTGWLNRAYA